MPNSVAYVQVCDSLVRIRFRFPHVAPSPSTQCIQSRTYLIQQNEIREQEPEPEQNKFRVDCVDKNYHFLDQK